MCNIADPTPVQDAAAVSGLLLEREELRAETERLRATVARIVEYAIEVRDFRTAGKGCECKLCSARNSGTVVEHDTECPLADPSAAAALAWLDAQRLAESEEPGTLHARFSALRDWACRITGHKSMASRPWELSLQKYVEALEPEVARLRAALEPFAEAAEGSAVMAKQYDDELDSMSSRYSFRDNHVLFAQSQGRSITFGDLRNARKALAAPAPAPADDNSVKIGPLGTVSAEATFTQPPGFAVTAEIEQVPAEAPKDERPSGSTGYPDYEATDPEEPAPAEEPRP